MRLEEELKCCYQRFLSVSVCLLSVSVCVCCESLAAVASRSKDSQEITFPLHL